MAALAGCGGEDVPDRELAFTTDESDLTACPGSSTLHGLDVSEWQGSINWTKAAAGHSYAIARVSDGTYVDPDFAFNWREMKRVGLVRGVYQFFRPQHDAVTQAKLVLSHTGALGAGDLPPVLDIEVTDGASPAQMRAGILAWAEYIEAHSGKRPILYVGSYFWNDNVKGGAEFTKYPLWLPAYGPTCPLLPSAWSHWAMHQYTSTGSVSGITGHVDLDLFDGTVADLKKLAGEPVCTPHCDGSVMVDAQCGRGDCGAYGARCVDDSLGLRCVFAACPNKGPADVCLSSSEIAHCDNGAITKGDCGAYGAFCSTAGRSAQAAHCVSSLCVSSATEVPKAHDACTTGGADVLECDANGAPKEVACKSGEQCSEIGDAHCGAKVCPASGEVDVCEGDALVHCKAGSARTSSDCAASGRVCTGSAGHAACTIVVGADAGTGGADGGHDAGAGDAGAGGAGGGHDAGAGGAGGGHDAGTADAGVADAGAGDGGHTGDAGSPTDAGHHVDAGAAAADVDGGEITFDPPSASCAQAGGASWMALAALAFVPLSTRRRRSRRTKVAAV